MATNSAANTPTGAAGTVLQGQGAGIALALSTATYPSTASSTGTILRANGTNWVATTATYPTTATANTLLYASASNVIGNLSTANSGVLTTSSSGVPSIDTTNFQVLSTGVQMKGNNTNTAPPAGFIGEVLSNSNTSGTTLSAGTGTNISSLTLTPGIWDVSGVLNFIGTGGANTVSYVEMAISTVSGANFTPADNFGSGIGMLQNQISGAVITTTTNCNLFCGPGRLSVSSNTTYYLNGVVTASTLNCKGYGVIRAVRVG